MPPKTPTFRRSQLGRAPANLQERFIGNRLFAVAVIKRSKSSPLPSLIAYDALRSYQANEPVYCLVRMIRHGLCHSLDQPDNPAMHHEDLCFLPMDPVILNTSHELAYSENQGLVYLKEIGEGAQGVVFLAHDFRRSTPTSTRLSAVKILEPPKDYAQLARQEREIRFHLKVSGHPNIVTLHRAYRAKQHYFLVMDFHPGSDLETFMLTNPSLYLSDTEKVRNVILQLIDAIQFIHWKGVYHW
jgi:Protein kinase domain